mmetsp:Transcript_7107/g.13434  ORF Transcript_7107/g.13434 Transcript_7107/m.13434 type:complete len:108 (+) Transcript_7107:3908-4231(+)
MTRLVLHRNRNVHFSALTYLGSDINNVLKSVRNFLTVLTIRKSLPILARRMTLMTALALSRKSSEISPTFAPHTMKKSKTFQLSAKYLLDRAVIFRIHSTVKIAAKM